MDGDAVLRFLDMLAGVLLDDERESLPVLHVLCLVVVGCGGGFGLKLLRSLSN